MGMQGQPIRLAEALRRAAHNAAREDPRFPPISPNELDQLDMEVWLLFGPREVTERGEALTVEALRAAHLRQESGRVIGKQVLGGL